VTRRQLYASVAILGYLLQQTIVDCNDHLALMEARANAELDRLRLAQVEHDQQKINIVLESAQELWQEKEAIEAKLKKATLRRKEARRLNELS